MKSYDIKYHTASRHCCRGNRSGSKIIRLQAKDVEDAKAKLRKKVPSARFEWVHEVNDGQKS